MSVIVNVLWKMHDDTKSIFRFTVQGMTRYLHKQHSQNTVDTQHLSQTSLHQNDNQKKPRPYSQRQRVGLILGPLLFLLIFSIPNLGGMQAAAQKMAAITALMATWWMCESIPIPITSLLPIVLYPALGLMSATEATAPFANQIIFLYMGGFIIALSMQRWHLHKRIAMHVIKLVGFSPARLVFGFMLATAILSAFVSNTATALMMMPIGLAVIMHVVDEAKKTQITDVIDLAHTHSAFGVNLMLGIAYAASIGGIATIIGTPPNMVLVGYVKNTYGYEITFAQWLAVGVPLVVVFLPLCWLWLTRVANPIKLKKLPGGKALIDDELKQIGKMNIGEKWTALIFFLTALGWIFRKPLSEFFPDPSLISDSSIAIAGAILLFVIPVNLKRNEFVMNWEWAVKLPWGILILFGGGLALAQGFQQTGFANWIGEQIMFLQHAPVLLVLISALTLIIFLTELTSNVATTAMVMPIFSAAAIAMGQDPLLLLVPVTMVASCAFMLPVATPPNAIVFGSGYVTMPQMLKSGFGLNILGIFVMTVLTYAVIMPAFDLSLDIFGIVF
jgi:sodium-dependent dicarboxylate transporter 2/3/5